MSSTNLLRSIQGAKRCISIPRYNIFQSSAFYSAQTFGRLSRSQLSSPACNYETRRYYNRRLTVKVPPTKPLTFPLAGDSDQPLEELNLDEPKVGFDVPELEFCDESVKKIFSLRYADGRAHKQKRLDNILSKVQEHPADVASLEVKIAKMTLDIRGQMKHCLAMRKDKFSKVMLLERIQKRRSWIEKLRKTDIEKFDWLLKELKIKYIPRQEYDKKLSKRALAQKQARDNFLAVKKAKIAEYNERLQKEREEFEQIKQTELVEIEKQLKEMGVDKFKNLHQVLDDLKLGKVFLDKKQRKPARMRSLEKKFELYKHRREESLK